MAQKRWTPYAEKYDPIEVGSIDGTDTAPHDKAIFRALCSEYQTDPFVKTKPKHSIFIARLSHKTTQEQLKHVFSQFGKIENCHLVRDFVTGFSKCYAFIEYESRSSASLACKEANDMELDGRKIFVDHELERRLPGWIPRRLGGGFGGNKVSGQLRFGGKDRPFKKPIVLENKR